MTLSWAVSHYANGEKMVSFNCINKEMDIMHGEDKYLHINLQFEGTDMQNLEERRLQGDSLHSDKKQKSRGSVPSIGDAKLIK